MVVENIALMVSGVRSLNILFDSLKININVVYLNENYGIHR